MTKPNPYFRNRWFPRYGVKKKVFHLVGEFLGDASTFVEDEQNFEAKSLCGRKMTLMNKGSTALCNSKWTCTSCQKIARKQKQ